ncbi:MAG: hypothetical protein K8T10_21210 [Candidatus Eremiobacteraeota bacterium]|nr:hypothetical protein [Candidatus Eremiobacteraeota bacterium]
MKPASAKENVERIREFLAVVKKMKAPALIYTSKEKKPVVIREIKKAFTGRKTHFIDPSIDEKEEVDRIFSASCKEGSLLLVSLDKSSLPVVTRRLEQIMEDGHIPINVSGNWRKVEPTDTWQTIVWIDADQINETEFKLREQFVYKLVL